MTEPEKVTARDILLATVLGLLAGLALVLVLGLANGCTPAQRQAIGDHSAAAAKFAACGLSVLDELEAERARAEEANREAARDQAIESIVRDGGTKE